MWVNIFALKQLCSVEIVESHAGFWNPKTRADYIKGRPLLCWLYFYVLLHNKTKCEHQQQPCHVSNEERACYTAICVLAVWLLSVLNTKVEACLWVTRAGESQAERLSQFSFLLCWYCEDSGCLLPSDSPVRTLGPVSCQYCGSVAPHWLPGHIPFVFSANLPYKELRGFGCLSRTGVTQLIKRLC